ncbi:hypothetical protein ABZV92_18600 [Streptomyces rubiginosohelvolus]|uniref:hypothetical protein n=1 Tax=Streptomyces rubiginosohelvolus TaxID=67362 RepID=UPI0033A4231E
MPLLLRQSLRMTAHSLMTPVSGPLKAQKHQGVRAAVRAAQRMRMTGAHWLVLLTTDREIFGKGEKADALYGVLSQILAEHPMPLVQDQGRRDAVPEETATG